ncbi:caspase family protein [Pseudobacter ginsenosidimutans]|uniref:WD40 repeat protein n=1 Tax=Pseudobacter ginsenosidimutans TaxID=661488 RepID=A0A4V2F1N8_9BACT|nr:caspase family protein [Pseudobacter ginsenosidimutans]QEC43071.1 PQQ-binding-like beta-propeller repeat protein [Pseudobacter ginsenosidimutans]RZS74426.1 WD40 repeat protein [Pseudobacter ginsenosidimutans]
MKVVSLLLSIVFMLGQIHAQEQDLRLMLPIGHTAHISSIQLSNEQEFLLTGANDNTIKVWDGKTGTMRLNIRMKGQVGAARLSHDENWIVGAASEDSVRVFNRKTGKLRIAKKVSWGTGGAIFSGNDSSILAFGVTDAQLFDAFTGKTLLTIPARNGNLITAVFSPDEKLILTCGTHGGVELWDVQTKKIRYRLQSAMEYVHAAIFSYDGSKVAVASDTALTIWNTTTGKVHLNLKHAGDAVRMTAFSPDDKYILSGNWRNETIIWEAATGRKVRTLTHSADLIAISPDGKKVALGGGDDRGVAVFDMTTGKKITHVYPRESLSQLLFSKTGLSFVTGTVMGHLDVFDAEKGDWRLTFNGHVHANWTSRFSPDGSTLLTSPYDGSLKLWDRKKGELKKTVWNIRGGPEFSPDGTKLIASCWDSTARIIDVASGETWMTMNGHKSLMIDACFNKDGSMAITQDFDGIVQLWDLVSRKSTLRIEAGPEVRKVAFNPDGTKFYLYHYHDKFIAVRSTKNGDVLYTVPVDNCQIDQFEFTHDGKYYFTSTGCSTFVGDAVTGKILYTKSQGSAGREGRLDPSGERLLLLNSKNMELWDWQNNRLIVKEEHTGEKLEKAFYSPDGKTLVITTDDGYMQIREAGTLRLITTLEGHEGGVNTIDFFSTENLMVSCGADFTGKLWDLKTGSLVYTFFALGNEDYFTLLPSHYYRSTPMASRMLYYTSKDQDWISFEQLDLKYNRPDLVLKSAGSANKKLISTFYEAYLRRLRRQGFDSLTLQSKVAAPQFDFANGKEFISTKQYPSKVSIRIRVEDRNLPLDRFNVWVNEVPLWNNRGVSLKHLNSGTFDTIITVSLSEGYNLVEGTAMNAEGLESLRKSMVIGKVPDEQKAKARKCYFVGVAIERFADTGNNLLWSVKDIRALAGAFKEKYGSAHIVIDTLFNEKVSLAAILQLKKKLLKADINDVVVIAYSGHGLLSNDFDYYFPTWQVDFSKPEKGGIPYDSLESLVNNIPPRQKLMIIDACHSGEVDKEDMKMGEEGGIAYLPDSYQSKGEAMAPQTVFELMQEIFPDVGRNSGTTILSASRGTQTANEWDEIKHSIFTYSILELLQQQPHASVWQLKEHTYRRVMELTNGVQRPTTRQEMKNSDWMVW